MSQGPDVLFDAALSLPLASRASLAEKLLQSLDGLDEDDVSAAWAEEAERRLEAFKQGKLKAIPGDEVMRSFSSQSK